MLNKKLIVASCLAVVMLVGQNAWATGLQGYQKASCNINSTTPFLTYCCLSKQDQTSYWLKPTVNGDNCPMETGATGASCNHDTLYATDDEGSITSHIGYNCEEIIDSLAVIKRYRPA